MPAAVGMGLVNLGMTDVPKPYGSLEALLKRIHLSSLWDGSFVRSLPVQAFRAPSFNTGRKRCC
jgi:hypothetical protein